MNTSVVIVDSLLVRAKRRSVLLVSSVEFLVSGLWFQVVGKQLRKLETRNMQLETLERDMFHVACFTDVENPTSRLSRYGR
jgi:hypothetical protein